MTNTSKFDGAAGFRGVSGMVVDEMTSDEIISDRKLSDMACMVNIISVGSTNNFPLSFQAGVKNSTDI